VGRSGTWRSPRRQGGHGRETVPQHGGRETVPQHGGRETVPQHGGRETLPQQEGTSLAGVPLFAGDPPAVDTGLRAMACRGPGGAASWPLRRASQTLALARSQAEPGNERENGDRLTNEGALGRVKMAGGRGLERPGGPSWPCGRGGILGDYAPIGAGVSHGLVQPLPANWALVLSGSRCVASLRWE